MGVKSLVQGLNAADTAGFEPRTVWSEVRRRNRFPTAPFFSFQKKKEKQKLYCQEDILSKNYHQQQNKLVELFKRKACSLGTFFVS